MAETDGQAVHNDILSHVILLEASLIEFRGFYLRKDTDGMLRALETFQERVGSLGDLFTAAMAEDVAELRESAQKKEQAS